MTSTDELRLDAAVLRRPCRLPADAFTTTADLDDLSGMIGQTRASEAIAFGIGTRRAGYNLFVMGPPGFGKRSLALDLLRARAKGEPAPPDWCYVNNFTEPHKPCALKLPSGRAHRLRADMQQLVEDLRASIPALFESEEYRSRAEQTETAINEQTERLFFDLGQKAMNAGVALVHTPGGFTLAPLAHGEVMDGKAFERLSEAEREAIKNKIAGFQDELQKTIRQAQRLQKEKREKIKALNREMTLSTVGGHIEELRERYAGLDEVLRYIESVSAAVLENIDDFRKGGDGQTNSVGQRTGDGADFRQYAVNVVVGNQGDADGAPVVVEEYPSYPNVVGRSEHVAMYGALLTDFTLIKPGALHRANGGYLLVDAQRLLTQPYAWEGLKRALASGEIRIESLEHSFGFMSTVALEPQPIPLDVKLVLFGERHIYYLLLAYDPAFAELFKVAADFEDDIGRGAQAELTFARLVATLARRGGLLPFSRAAVERLIEQTGRWAGDAERLSMHVQRLEDLLCEAERWARAASAPITGAEHVDRAVQAQLHRAGRIRDRTREEMLRGVLFIATDGEAVGQVNGLSVMMLGEHAFAHPTRITATTRVGGGEVMDIQREVDLGGPIHSKGVLILSAFLAARYSQARPHALAASLSFEQTYGAIDGDSASVAELAALVSSVGRFALRQSLAVTGSVNQHGAVQPIGAVNEKIEGFFDLCAARGLNGEQGVIIPYANRLHLMLREDIVQAVAEGRFHVYAVRTVDEAFELLSGLPAGQPDAGGRYPPGSVNGRVAERLAAFGDVRREALGGGRARRYAREPQSASAPRRGPRGRD
ncbi:MAG: AAA family ATPase [Gammaproteobacteria bacterium]